MNLIYKSPVSGISLVNGTCMYVCIVFRVSVSNTDIQDTQAPVVTNCPQDITQPIAQGAQNSLVTFTAPTVTDNSGEDPLLAYINVGQGQALRVTQVNPGRYQSTFPLGSTEVNVQATDLSGNTNSQCTFFVTIVGRYILDSSRL